jgi:hypothetical protein
MNADQYIRKPFPVEAVPVTTENFEEVAAWCGGSIKPDSEGEKHIRVRVKHPLNSRQTRAYVGDWILKAGDSFKVYTAKAFENSFEEAPALNAPDGPPQEEMLNVFDQGDELPDELVVPPGTRLTRADFEVVNPATSR